MPNVTLEYSGNLAGQFDVRKALLKLNEALLATGEFEEPDIKSRAMALDTFLIGTSPGERAFVHLKVSIFGGRSTEVKREISRKLLEVLHGLGDMPEFEVQLCVEMLAIDRETYAKENLR